MNTLTDWPLECITPLTEAYEQQAREVIESGLLEHWPSYDETMNPDVLRLHRTYGSNMLIGLKDDRVVATGAWLIVETTVASIVRMSVAKPFRRQGVASRMLSALERRIANQGYSRIVLETTSHWHGAVRFYTDRGYRLTHQVGGDSYFVKDIDPQAFGGGSLTG